MAVVEVHGIMASAASSSSGASDGTGRPNLPPLPLALFKRPFALEVNLFAKVLAALRRDFRGTVAGLAGVLLDDGRLDLKATMTILRLRNGSDEELAWVLQTPAVGSVQSYVTA